MRWDELGLPQDNGSSDKQDSARLAGILTLFGWPQKVDLKNYLTLKWHDIPRLLYCRHPLEFNFDFSRDQYICLASGLSIQYPQNVNENYITGSDFLSPSVKGHTQRCKGLKASWWQDQWLKAEIYINAKFSPLGEPNQILCMCVVAGPEWVKRYCNANPRWRDAINLYWRDSYRNEPELAEWVISKIEQMIK